MYEFILLNGNKLDLPNDFNPLFNFILFDTQDLQNLGGVYSYTITLPATENNRRIFKFNDLLNVAEDISQNAIKGVLYFNGLPLSNDCTLRVSGFNYKGFQANFLLNISSLGYSLADKTLQELTNLGGFMYDMNTQNYTNFSANVVTFLGARSAEKLGETFGTPYGLGYNNEVWWRNFPSVKMTWVFEQILSEAGYTLDSNIPTQFSNLNILYLHYCNEISNVEQLHEEYRLSRYVEFVLNTDVNSPNASTPVILQASQFVRVGAGAGFASTSGQQSLDVEAIQSYSIYFEGEITAFTGYAVLEVGYMTDPSNPATFVPFRFLYSEITAIANNKKYNFGFTFSGNMPNNKIYFRFRNGWLLEGFKIVVEPTNYIPEGKYYWDIAKNLPAIKQRDFVKALLLLSGCILILDELTMVATIVNIQNAIDAPPIDITENIDFDSFNIDFIPSGAGQKMILKYANTFDGSAEIVINDVNIETRKEFVLPFDRYPLEYYYERFAPIQIRRLKSKTAFRLPSQNEIDTGAKGVREHDTRHAIEIENEYKETKPLFGTNGRSMFASDITNYVIWREPFNQTIPLAPPFLPYNFDNTTTKYLAVNFNTALYRGLDSLQDLSSIIAISHYFNLFVSYRKLSCKALIDFNVLNKIRDRQTLYIGANVCRRFLPIAVKNWNGGSKLCDLELIRINE